MTLRRLDAMNCCSSSESARVSSPFSSTAFIALAVSTAASLIEYLGKEPPSACPNFLSTRCSAAAIKSGWYTSAARHAARAAETEHAVHGRRPLHRRRLLQGLRLGHLLRLLHWHRCLEAGGLLHGLRLHHRAHHLRRQVPQHPAHEAGWPLELLHPLHERLRVGLDLPEL